VEAVRGVNIDGVLQTLMERGLVKIAGRAEIPGRPLLYETTQFFLDHFGLRSLEELPNVEELRKRDLPVARSVAGIGDAGGPESPTPATAGGPESSASAKATADKPTPATAPES
jgi:segregation and condensation protein B